ncbi:hypothetical protein ABFG93_13660 [Pseudalkalibacillus hwajinpoensis]|uniref:hypothetical protein n=1 Tax=Guptibacillus hwajinpoensis TaxID=208199 RepID=UPI00325AC47F
MWPIIGISVVTAVITLYEVPKLMKNNQKRDLWVFSILMLMAFGLSMAETLHLPIPTPFDFITFLFRPMSRAIEILLG